MKTRMTELFGIKYPIMIAGMNWLTTPKLVAAVSNAGGLGVLAGNHQTPDGLRDAIKEMYRQVGDLVLDESGIAQKGLIVRHLILPNRLAGSQESLAWLVNEVSPAVTVSIMAQYYPAHLTMQHPLLSRKINEEEYEEVLGLLEEFGVENGWIQEIDASDTYRPDFDGEGHPFEVALGRLR